MYGLLRFGVVRLHVRRPQLQRRLLHGAAVGERQRPRVRADLVHRVQMRGGLLVSLAAGQEHDARQRSDEDTSELQSLMRISYAVFCVDTDNADRRSAENKTEMQPLTRTSVLSFRLQKHNSIA